MTEIALNTLLRCVYEPKLYVVTQLQIFTEINEETNRSILMDGASESAGINPLGIENERVLQRTTSH